VSELTIEAFERPPFAWLREHLATTPGRYRLLAILLATTAAIFGIVTATAATARRHATDAVASQTEPLLVEADGLYAALSDADATAATTFLRGGIEPAARRRRYLNDVRAATSQLTTLTREVRNSPVAAGAVSTISTQLPVYSGLIETARANNRQGFPVGAAYLRQASDLMRATILPAADRLYAVEAQRLLGDYRSGVGRGRFVVVVLMGVLALAALVASQLYVTRRTHRLLNLPMLAATVVLLAVLVWTLTAFTEEQDALATAQRKGSDPVEVLSATRILTLRAEGDESLALVARGGGDQYIVDFALATRALGSAEPSKRLLGEESSLARRTRSTAAFTDFRSTLARYQAVHERVLGFEWTGDFPDAIKLAVGPNATEARLADRLNRNLGRQLAAAQHRFAGDAGDATSALDGLWLGIPLLAAAAGALGLLGLYHRIKEYR
jgi:hypothetical protein